jgi:hypothetical protein
MGIEYTAAIAEGDYHAFKMLVSTPLPREYDMATHKRTRKAQSNSGAGCCHRRGSSAPGGIRRILQEPQATGFQHHGA